MKYPAAAESIFSRVPHAGQLKTMSDMAPQRTSITSDAIVVFKFQVPIRAHFRALDSGGAGGMLPA